MYSSIIPPKYFMSNCSFEIFACEYLYSVPSSKDKIIPSSLISQRFTGYCCASDKVISQLTTETSLEVSPTVRLGQFLIYKNKPIYNFWFCKTVILKFLYFLILNIYSYIHKFFSSNFVQAAFGPNNWDIRLKFCIQPLIVIIYKDHEENFRSEVIDLHFDLHELRKYGKISPFSL